LAERLQVGVGPHRHVLSQVVSTGDRGTFLVFLEELHGAGEVTIPEMTVTPNGGLFIHD
jgi:hypothetical protein